MNKKSRFGFTLAELLIVVAIIAVLVAVSIPIFVGRIQASKEAACAANCRSLKQVLSSAYMTDSSEEEVKQAYDAHKSEYTCPLGGTISYQISDGLVNVSCSHHDKDNNKENPLSNKDTMKTLFAKLSSLRKTVVPYNNNSSSQDKKIISDALKEIGVDIGSLPNWAVCYDNSDYPKLYW